VGANEGQESALYARFGLPVIWIEPNPVVFAILEKNIHQRKDQRAIKGLVTDIDDKEYEFHLANNKGESSSILEMNLHKEVWPQVHYEKTVLLRSDTLPSLLSKHQVDLNHYNMLIMDTQGSELMVLKGAEPILTHFQLIKTEVPDFESYKGCCQLQDIESFLVARGYKEVYRNQFAARQGGGAYYDIIYQKLK
jgi:FkbM family methyltransferase